MQYGPIRAMSKVGLLWWKRQQSSFKAGAIGLVQLPNGTQGYLLSRYLTPQPPARHRFDQLQEKNKHLTVQATGLQEENNRLKAENEKLAAAAGGYQKETDAVRREYEVFKVQASDVASLKARYDAAVAELDQKNKEIAALNPESASILRDVNLYWFLAGAGVLLAGLLIGLSLKRQRRWSSLT
jgi:SH3 domain protein